MSFLVNGFFVNGVLIDGVPMTAYYPTYVLTRDRFLIWSTDCLFPAVDTIGQAGVATLESFRLDLTVFHLPEVWDFLERATPGDPIRDDHHVFFNANSIGITAYPQHWKAAFEGFSDARRVSVRHMQAAHTCLWRWLLVLARTHLANPSMTADQVIAAALPEAPTRATRYDGPFIFPPTT